MKRILLCSFVVLSFFGLMVVARGGGGGRGGFGGGRHMGGGTVAHMGGGAGRAMAHSGAAGAGAHSLGHQGYRNNNYGNRWNNGAYGNGVGFGLWAGAPFWPAGYTYRSYCNEYPDDEQCYRN